jgi:hypothetical protein
LLAILLRLTWKDSLPGLAPFFYATPLALIWSGWAVSSALFFMARKRSLAVLSAVMAVACWAWWQQACLFAAPQVPTTESLKVVFWNTARLKSGWPALSGRISELSCPLMGFVEAGAHQPKDRERWQRDFPLHQPVFFGNGMVLLTQARVLETASGPLGKGSHYGRARLEWDGRHFTVFLVDIHSSPFRSRAEPLKALTELAREISSEPVVLMGDFNTPADSVHFDPLRGDFRNSFEAAGRGNSATWPVPGPVLAIDQIWTSRQVAANRVWHDGSLQSDHAAVIAELSFSE